MRFLRPTMRGWVVALAAAAWLLAAIVNRMVFPFLMGCGALALLLVSLASAAASLWGLRLRRGPCGDASCGETVALPLVLENRFGRRRQPVAVIETVPFAAEPSLGTVVPPLRPHETRVVQRRVLAMRRGEFTLRRVVLRGGDPAGLFCRERRFDLPQAVLVYPGSEPLPELMLHASESPSAVAGSPVSATGMNQEFYGVREYHPADGLRYIHWKSTARHGRLMVREFERNAVVSVAVLVDANEHFVSGSDQRSNLEYQIRAAASICRHCAGLYCSFALAAAGDGVSVVRPAQASTACAEALYALATLRPGSTPLTQPALELGRLLPRDTVMFCFSLAAPHDLADALAVLAERGMDVRWYCARREVFLRRTLSGPIPAPAPGGGLRSLAPAEVGPGMSLVEALGLHPLQSPTR